MSTSLAEQLQRLAVPQTTRLQQDKKRASLLFDPKEAASLNKETAYQIGIDGLEELKERDIVFAEFENTIFHVTAKDFERSVETAQANQKLDKNIRRFLYLLSPHFMFNCSYKALEWLVYRYYIHEYNKEDLLMLILPYHETNIFVRTLQLLNLKSPKDKWHWMKPLQKTGVHLTKQVLYNNLASNSHFLECISNYVVNIVKEHTNPSCLTTVYNFYCSSFAGALEYSEQVTEIQISQMLPVLLNGLSSSTPDFAASSYIICAQLFSKIQLSSNILNKFTNKICQVQVAKLKNEAVLVLLVLYQTQKHHTFMANIKILSGSQLGLVRVIEKYHREGMNVNPLLIAILKSAIEEILMRDDEGCKMFVDEILNEIKFDQQFIDPLIRCLLETCSDINKSSTKNNDWVKEFLCKIERQYPAEFDKAIKDIMKLTKKRTSLQKTICDILGDIGNIDSIYDLMEKLYHPNSDTRLESVKVLRKKFDMFRERDREAIENAILDRIKDDCVEVTCATLEEFRMKLASLNFDRLKSALLELIVRCQNAPAFLPALPMALELLCQYFDASDIQIFLTVLPFLLPTSEAELATARLVLKSTYGAKSPMLLHAGKNLAKVNAFTFASNVYQSLCENVHPLDMSVLVKTLKEMPEGTNTVYKCMGLLLMCSALPSTTDFEIACLVLDIIEMYMSQNEISQSEQSVSSYILLARKNKLSLHCLLDCVKKLISKITPKNVSLNCHDFNMNEETSTFIIRILKMLTKGTSKKKKAKSEAYKSALSLFLKHFCSNDVILTSEFLLNLTISDNQLIDEELRFNCILLLKSITEKNVKLSKTGLVIPYLLVGLTSHDAALRKEIADVLIFYYTNLQPAHAAYAFLVQFSEHIQEVVMDNEGCAQVIQTVYMTDAAKTLIRQLAELLHGNYPLYFKAGILTLLHKTADFQIYNSTSQTAAEILKNCGETFDAPQSRIIEINIGSFSNHHAREVNENSTAWSFISSCIRNDKSILANEKQTCPSALMLEGIDREIFSHLKQNVKKLILNEIIEVATNTTNAEVLQAAGHVFKRIDIDSTLVLEPLQRMKDVRSPSLNPQKLKRRVTIVPTVDILETADWRRGVTVLEFIQDKKKIRNTNLLLGTLFEILKKCLDFEEQANVEYPKQLLLSTILHCCQKLDSKIAEGAFDMQLVVQCIRASQNPQTHHHALLLLAEIASLIPKQVLHHIIAIFTFMGSSVLRHDDEYSFQIITKIIDTVTPILIEDGKTESVAQVLRVFVDAVLDIPEHRRMRLFKQLLTRIDTKENLHLFVLIVLEAQVVHGQAEKQKAHKSLTTNESPKRLDIAAELCREFSPEIVINTCIKVLQYLSKLPEEKKNDTQNIDNYTFDIQRYTPKQFRHYKYIIIFFISNLLSSKQFVTQVAALSETDMQQLETSFKEAIIVMLKHIQTTAKLVDSNINTPQSQYWRVMLHYSCDTLDALNSLLTEKMFLLVIHGLMVYSLSTIRKRALDLLNNKLQDKTDFINECDKEELFNVIVTPLINIIRTIEDPNLDADQEQVIQKALLSLKLIVKHLGADNPEKFRPILNFTAELVQNGRGAISDNVLASLILCVAELCNQLRAHAITSLTKCMPVMLKLLKPNKEAAPSLLVTSNVAAINKILDSLSLFLSPFLKKLLCGVSILAAKWGMLRSDDAKITVFNAKVQSVQGKLGQLVPFRVLLPAVQESYAELVNKGKFSGIEPLMKILCESLNALKGNDVQGHLGDLTNFFLQALQLRTDGKCEDVEQIEENIIKAISSLVLKLSETTFRPLYYKIFDWAVRTDVKTARVITFYNLSHVFANSLKGLFSLFAGHFLNNAAKLLDECNQVKSESLYFDEETKSVMLVENILKTLHTIFMYDSQKFVNKERFEVLMQPIVDQLENALDGLDNLETRANKILIPCIAQFAVATADDSLWKQMNYQILLKTRHNTSKIRLIALNAVGETAKKLGEDFLPLLPETIPFLAELLEDEDEVVEKSCQKMLQELEKVLGEPLQKYF
uniref:HEAT repeat-containing protein 1 n=1 Tax=Photinus pyralis TaxID=7054 RepID=A0A1Y1MKS6_PHOPY